MSSRRLTRLLAVAFVFALLAWQLWPSARGDRATAVDAPASAAAPAAQPPAPASVAADDAATASLPATALPAFLPAEAGPVIRTIQQGGRFPHRQDGSVFGNREGRLPSRPRGWYREYTVPTPGLPHRGARRIVTGGDPPRDWYYTDDHYDSFRAFQPPAAEDLR